MNSALSFIDEVGNAIIPHYTPADGLLRYKAIVILTWLGFTPSEIADTVYSDFKVCNGIFIEKGNKKIEVRSDLYDILSRQAEQNNLMAFPSGRTYTHKIKTEYLIKNHSGEQVNTDHLYHLFKQFNQISDRENILSFRGLELSSLFTKVRNDTSSNDLCTKIQKYANCNHNMSYGYKKLYLQWLKKFFNEKTKPERT